MAAANAFVPTLPEVATIPDSSQRERIIALTREGRSLLVASVQKEATPATRQHLQAALDRLTWAYLEETSDYLTAQRIPHQITVERDFRPRPFIEILPAKHSNLGHLARGLIKDDSGRKPFTTRVALNSDFGSVASFVSYTDLKSTKDAILFLDPETILNDRIGLIGAHELTHYAKRRKRVHGEFQDRDISFSGPKPPWEAGMPVTPYDRNFSFEEEGNFYSDLHRAAIKLSRTLRQTGTESATVGDLEIFLRNLDAYEMVAEKALRGAEALGGILEQAPHSLMVPSRDPAELFALVIQGPSVRSELTGVRNGAVLSATDAEWVAAMQAKNQARRIELESQLENATAKMNGLEPESPDWRALKDEIGRRKTQLSFFDGADSVPAPGIPIDIASASPALQAALKRLELKKRLEAIMREVSARQEIVRRSRAALKALGSDSSLDSGPTMQALIDDLATGRFGPQPAIRE